MDPCSREHRKTSVPVQRLPRQQFAMKRARQSALRARDHAIVDRLEEWSCCSNVERYCSMLGSRLYIPVLARRPPMLQIMGAGSQLGARLHTLRVELPAPLPPFAGSFWAGRFSQLFPAGLKRTMFLKTLR